MKHLALLSLVCLTLATVFAPVSSALADAHKDTFRKTCNGTKAC